MNDPPESLAALNVQSNLAHAELPGEEVDPDSHGAHVALEMAFTAKLYEPEGHERHDAAPGAVLYEPG